MPKIITFLTITALMLSCDSTEKNHAKKNAMANKQQFEEINYSIISTKSLYTQNDTVTIKAVEKNAHNISATINNDSLSIKVVNDSVFNVLLSENTCVGRQRMLITSNDSIKPAYKNMTIVAAQSPTKKKFKIHKILTHNITDYTQGLIYEDGMLYESTGIKGKSVIRKSNFVTGAVINEKLLPSNYFGEGIAIMGDTIVQLTWQSNTGFIYQKSTFNKIREFNYSTEGWGITTIKNRFVMSDGSEYLHFLEPGNFTVEYSIQAYDNYGPVKQLNELEYHNGYIYANVYMQDYLVKINAKTGAVVERIYVTNVLEPKDKHSTIDVLNGIAIIEDQFLITGKNWPKMFVGEFIDF